MEPRLVAFHDQRGPNQGFIVAEKEMIFETTNFTVAEGLACLLATYYTPYISYPKSAVAADELLFIQEMLLQVEADKDMKKRFKYKTLVSAIID